MTTGRGRQHPSKAGQRSPHPASIPADFLRPTPEVTQRSPKGLLTIENAGWDRERGLWLEKIGPDQHAIRGQDRKKSIKDCIAFWRRFACGLIEASGKKPADYLSIAKSEVLDRACAAARILVQLDIAEAHIRPIEQDSASLNAVGACLTLASCVHHLTVVDNEVAIASTGGRRKFLRESQVTRTQKAERERGEDQKMADELWRKHPGWGKSAVAEEIRKRRGGNANTIRRRITKQK
jgi:hypothetical protein